MLYPMRELLAHAKKHKYAVGAFNVLSMDQAEAVIQCAEALRAPLILQIAEVHIPFMQYEALTDYLSSRIARSFIPVSLHLDHGVSFKAIVQAVQNGFSSVMFDGSKLDYEDNVSETRKVVELCGNAGLTTEAELGCLGDEGTGGGKSAKDYYTNPEQAVDFVKRTGIDALAIAFGNGHGFYKGEPQLDFTLLDTIVKTTAIPIVLHGGSGISESDFKKAISLGICKINIFTSMEAAILSSMTCPDSRQNSDHQLARGNAAVFNAVQDAVGSHIKMFGGVERCPGKYTA